MFGVGVFVNYIDVELYLELLWRGIDNNLLRLEA
jgi:hypothetical protein